MSRDTTKRGIGVDYDGNDPRLCNARTLSGRPCRALKVPGGTRCVTHGGMPRREGTLWYYRKIASVFTARGVPMAGELQSVVEAMAHHPK